MSFYAVNEDPIEVVLVVKQKVARRPEILALFFRVEDISEANARNAAADKYDGFVTGQFLVQFHGIAIKIVEREVEYGVIDLVSA